jgi:hypothetical protein
LDFEEPSLTKLAYWDGGSMADLTGGSRMCVFGHMRDRVIVTVLLALAHIDRGPWFKTRWLKG